CRHEPQKTGQLEVESLLFLFYFLYFQASFYEKLGFRRSVNLVSRQAVAPKLGAFLLLSLCINPPVPFDFKGRVPISCQFLENRKIGPIEGVKEGSPLVIRQGAL
ncbi:MAG: hypothetical protein VB051_12505, partial [Candidatus Pelethousia sp.]|nr:hypothetical protein [Candidatus Pelethousia sp.]